MNNQNNPVIITPRDLPLHCSGPEHADSWNGHPRVFLPIQSNARIAVLITTWKAKFIRTTINSPEPS